VRSLKLGKRVLLLLDDSHRLLIIFAELLQFLLQLAYFPKEKVLLHRGRIDSATLHEETVDPPEAKRLGLGLNLPFQNGNFPLMRLELAPLLLLNAFQVSLSLLERLVRVKKQLHHRLLFPPQLLPLTLQIPAANAQACDLLLVLPHRAAVAELR